MSSLENPTVEIRYGSSLSTSDPGCFYFSGMPTPYLSRSQEMVSTAGKWCQLTTLTLNGSVIGSETVPGDNLNTQSIIRDREKILKGFSESFGRLAIYENNSPIKTFHGCFVRDLDFSPANYGRQEYTVTLECYEEDVFEGVFGVLDPVDSISFTDNQDGTVGIEHTVSARGFSTNHYIHGFSGAIINAKNFVESRTGYTTNAVIPHFISGIDDNNLVLRDVQKDINRVDGTYSCVSNYQIQTGGIGQQPITAGVVNQIDTTISSGINEDFITVGVNYTIIGDKYADVATIRSKKPSSNTLHQIATGAVGLEGINTVPTDISVEDTAQTNQTIKVSANFDNNLIFETLGVDVYFDYNVDMTTDDTTDVASVSINGELKARGSNRAKWNLINNFWNTVLSSSTPSAYLYFYANDWYRNINYNILYGNVAWALNPEPQGISVDVNEIEGTIKLSAQFNNKDYKADFRNFVYKVDVNPALTQYIAKPSCNQNGLYTVFNLNTRTREEVTLNIQSKAANTNSDFTTEMHNYAESLRNDLVGGTQDLVISSEAGELTSSYFDSSINQTYSYQAGQSFY
tara:strand:- start:3 stop:1721 length:1719 start_codon:yes stop_codon:yes gene_type:complete